MKLKSGLHLAYCTNLHRGDTWEETFAALNECTLKVRDRVCSRQPFGIGLRLSDEASRTLVTPQKLAGFRQWLDGNECYVFTINGFPFGRFHGGFVKEQVFAPDWTSDMRVDYTNRLFDILAALLPAGVEGSVSTLPGSFKEFITNNDQRDAIEINLWRCIEHVADLSERTGKELHLAVEPEPFGLFENTNETLRFFERIQNRRPNDARAPQHFGLNYDACHFALQYEDPQDSLDTLAAAGVKLSKIHLSSALRTIPNETSIATLRRFADDVYLHQVIARSSSGDLFRYKDLPIALASREPADEWRIHFHVPLYATPHEQLSTTADHVLGVLDWLAATPTACRHLEMETYTWEVLPDNWKSANVVDQLTREYEWTRARLAERGLA